MILDADEPGMVRALDRLGQDTVRRQAGDDRVTRAMLQALLADLLAVPAATFAADGRVEPERARILPGGIIIFEALMDRFHLDEASVSQGGIREGVLLELLERSGDGGS